MSDVENHCQGNCTPTGHVQAEAIPGPRPKLQARNVHASFPCDPLNFDGLPFGFPFTTTKKTGALKKKRATARPQRIPFFFRGALKRLWPTNERRVLQVVQPRGDQPGVLPRLSRGPCGRRGWVQLWAAPSKLHTSTRLLNLRPC